MKKESIDTPRRFEISMAHEMESRFAGKTVKIVAWKDLGQVGDEYVTQFICDDETTLESKCDAPLPPPMGVFHPEQLRMRYDLSFLKRQGVTEEESIRIMRTLALLPGVK